MGEEMNLEREAAQLGVYEEFLSTDLSFSCSSIVILVLWVLCAVFC